MNKRETHIVTGMTRDLFASRFDNKFVVDARNIRITSTKGNATLLSVTNEKGTGVLSVNGTIEGVVLGHAVLDRTLVLFTTEHTDDSGTGNDRIYKLDFSEDFSSATATLLFEGDLNFYYKNPLETLPYYETNSIQKVYWVDRRNQPRVIDIKRGYQSNPDVFNFNRKIGSNHIMLIEKYNTGGQFPAGTIQYCFNYFNKFGQETNIVDVSPMYYLSPKENGLPADGMDTSSFVIKLENISPDFEYVRLYAITRTSENAVPNVRIVGDYNIQATREVAPFTLVEDSYVVLDPDNIDIIDINTGYVKYALTSRYDTTQINTSIDVPVQSEEYALDRVSGRIYGRFSAQTGNKYSELTFYRGTDDFRLVRMSQSARIKYTTFLGGTVVSNIVITDTGIVGSTIDASALLFIGGQDIIAGTFTSKNNTLFLGNIKQNIPNIGTLITSSGRTVASEARGTAESCVFNDLGEEKSPNPTSTIVNIGSSSDASYYNYPYDNNKSSYNKKSFKAREGYRLGFIAQYNTGQWSEVVWIDDLDEECTPSITMFYRVSSSTSWNGYYKKPGFKAVLPSRIVDSLLNNGFIRVAPVVCYPEDADRKVPFQGLLSGTVYNVLDRNTNSPFAQADWRFRVGYDDNRINGEIQCNTFDAAPEYPVYAIAGSETPQSSANFLKYYGNQYYRDSSILTFHSPDVEYREDIAQGDFTDLKMRIVGISTLSFIESSRNNNYINQIPERTLAAYLYVSSKGFGKKSTKRTLNYFADWRTKVESSYRRRYSSEETEIKDYYADLAYIGYYDNAIYEVETVQSGQDLTVGQLRPTDPDSYYDWVTYLWHRNGSLNNQAALSEAANKYGSIRYAMLEKKCISETQYSRTTFFQSPTSVGPSFIDVDINQPVLFDSDQLGVTKVSVGNKVSVDYYGNIDKVITPTFEDMSGVECPVGSNPDMANLSNKGYPIEFSNMGTIVEQTTGRKDFTGSYSSFVSRSSHLNPSSQDSSIPDFMYGSDPVHMRYKSTKHVVIGLASEDETIKQIGVPPTSSYPAFWEGDNNVDRVDVLSSAFNSLSTFINIRNSVFVAELYREFSEERLRARFGGTSENAISNNVWKRCGESIKLIEGQSATVYFREGDTYIGRYDCLKTYPFSPQDQNQIVSIFSTELESRVNLDARYDKNKGLTDNTFANPANFGLYNHPGYEQTNQFFTFKAIDYDRYRSLNHPNLVSFTTEKKPGADVDAWTSVPMTATFDLKGELGEITKLTTFNDTLLSFQNRGVAQILFNERVQIPASDGQPIEITNGLKFGGYRYLSDQIGMTNKWSLQTTPNGVYFIDDEKNTLYHFGGQQFQDLSGKAGFRTWLAENNSYDVWNPVDYNNFKTWYDRVNGDLYFMNKDESLVYSEQIGNFISFMDYGKLPLFVNMNDKFLSAKYNSTSGEDTIWELWAGQYNMFFGQYRPYWLTFISNTDPTTDKIFNNLSWRTFDYNSEGDLQPLSTFDTVRVWNDHQDTGEVPLIDINGKPSNLKKKFNVFRALVPRDTQGAWGGRGLNRIRSVLAYIKLSRNHPNIDKMIFGDFDVDFFE